jgi:hypothetical protein
MADLLSSRHGIALVRERHSRRSHSHLFGSAPEAASLRDCRRLYYLMPSGTGAKQDKVFKIDACLQNI